MPSSVRYQIFISSTFTDLKEERAEVIQAIWEMDSIPTGMEAFVAANESQWEMIKRVIDECDYYILIIGGRYGSVTSDGISYTEQEYQYAKSLSIPILAFVHSEPESIVAGKTDLDEQQRARLTKFRDRVKAEYPIRTWKTPAELGGVVSRSLIREIKLNPRPGWVRNDGGSPLALLERVAALSEENKLLREAEDKSNISGLSAEDLASGDDTITLEGSVNYSDGEFSFGSKEMKWSAEVTWDDIFRTIGPTMMSEATETSISERLAEFYKFDDVVINLKDMEFYSPELEVNSFDDVIVQFRALGLINQGTKKRGVNDRSKYWSLSTHGDNYLVNLLAKRRRKLA